MKNTVDARIEFSFKGKTLAPSTTIDLDRLMEDRGDMALIYSLVASENGIDPYSYEYEVLQSSDIRFDNAHGLAEAFVYDGELDLAQFAAAWEKAQRKDALQALAKKHMGINRLDEIPGLHACLMEAYELGKDAAR